VQEALVEAFHVTDINF